MDDQDIVEARERVTALRKQIRSEQSERAIENLESAKEVRLSALSEEERHLEQQLEEVRGSVPVLDLNTPPVPEGGLVNIPVEEIPEGADFVETVDVHGNLVRTLVEDAGTREADAPPPNVPDDATMTSRDSRP